MPQYDKNAPLPPSSTPLITHLITHDGAFHADDVLAYTILHTLFPSATLLRTRDNLPQWAENPQAILFDVGGTFNDINVFDHHQGSFTLSRSSSATPKIQIPYSSAGLIWRKFGRQWITHQLQLQNQSLTTNQIHQVWQQIENGLIQSVDALDSGLSFTNEIPSLNISSILAHFNSTYPLKPTPENAPTISLQRFHDAANFANTILTQLFANAASPHFAYADIERQHAANPFPHILELTSSLPWGPFLQKHPEILFVIFERINSQQQSEYAIQAVALPHDSFSKKVPFPCPWAGKEFAELAAISSIASAIFCHKAQFFMVVGTKEDAYKTVELVLQYHHSEKN